LRAAPSRQRRGRRDPPVVQTEFNEGFAQFSPDGRWIAYQSNKTGRLEIYLRPFPGPGADERVSVDGGAQVRWNSNGGELFYVATDRNQLMAVPIRFVSGGTPAELGAPLPLFAATVDSTAGPVHRHQYMVSRDGQSFVMHSSVAAASASPISVILNWKPSR
jgi:Tol biopolymer transport system component